MRGKKPVGLAIAASALLVLAACGGGSSSSSSGGGAQSAGLDGVGPITYVQGKDNSNVVRPLLDQWNKQHPDQQVTFKEQTEDANQQHDDLVQHFQAQDAGYDVASVDVVWTAEFAAKGWLQPLTGEFAVDNTGILPATVDSATYNGTQYAAPKNTNGGLLYYRSDLLPAAPKTWAELSAACEVAKTNNIDCYAGQFAPYEGRTVNTA